MPSRKRNQGRTRRAKADAREPPAPDNRTAKTIEALVQEKRQGVGCYHGSQSLPQGHVIHKYLTQFGCTWIKILAEQQACMSSGAAYKALLATIDNYSEIWENEQVKSMLQARLLSNGANLLLDGGNDLAVMHAAGMAMAIVVLGFHEPGKRPEEVLESSENFKLLHKHADVFDCCQRAVTKFYAKRIPCSCLDQRYALSRALLTKTGLCSNCKQRKERSKLFMCQACRLDFYCGEECQKAHWPVHKKDCKINRGVMSAD